MGSSPEQEPGELEMNVRTYDYRNARRVSTWRPRGKATALSLAAAVFALSLAAPVTIDIPTGFAVNSAHAGNHGGGNGNSGGNGNAGGSNTGGNGNADGSNTGGGNENAGPDNNNAGGNPGPDKDSVASVDADLDRREDDSLLLLLPPPEEVVTMAMFTTRISKRYPADEITGLADPHQAVSFFSELKDMSGKRITHMWYYGGELQFKASFKVRADQWRVWSTQLLPENMPGDWKVEVVDMAGKVLVTQHLKYTPPPATVATN